MSTLTITTTSPKQKPINDGKAIHFPGLNAFRFLAAALVVLVHVESARQTLVTTSFSLPVSDGTGGLAVTFFFVLSGFLITFLLLREKETSGTIAIKKFYWRRVLRIWPLYYLIIAIAFGFLNNSALLPSIADTTVYEKAPANLFLYLLFLPNVAWVSGLQILYANQLWSVGVEEQFYLFWPLVAKYLSRRGLLYFMVGLIIGFIVVRNSAAFLIHYPAYSFLSTPALSFINNLLTATRISCMAIGGIGAYALYFYPGFVQRLLSSTLVDIIVTGTVLLLAARNTYIPYVMYEAFGVLFCYIILSCSCKAGSLLQLESKTWSWLGNLSYGIYMWHMIVLGILSCLLKSHIVANGLPTDLLLYIGTLPLTILVAWLSYNYIEKPFLELKKRFVVVNSRA